MSEKTTARLAVATVFIILIITHIAINHVDKVTKKQLRNPAIVMQYYQNP